MNNFSKTVKCYISIIELVYKEESNYRTSLNNLLNNIKYKVQEYFPNYYENSLKKSTEIIKEQDNEYNELYDEKFSKNLSNLVNFYTIKKDRITKTLLTIKAKIKEKNEKLINYSYEKKIKEYNLKQEKYNEKLNEAKVNYFKEMQEIEKKVYDLETIKKYHKTMTKKERQNLKDDSEQRRENLAKLIDDKKPEIFKLKQKYKSIAKKMELLDNNYKSVLLNDYYTEMIFFNDAEYDIVYTMIKEFGSYYKMIDSILKEIKGNIELNKKDLILKNQYIKNLLDYKKTEIVLADRFIEYKPIHINFKEDVDLNLLQTMKNEFGLEPDKCFDKEADSKEMKFILLVDKVVKNLKEMSEDEILKLKSFFIESDKNIIKFLIRVNIARSKPGVFNNEISFKYICDIFNTIISNYIYKRKENHQIIKFIFILSQTFYIIRNEKKEYINHYLILKSPLLEISFWNEFLEEEIVKLKEDKGEHEDQPFITIISSLRSMVDFLKDDNKCEQIIQFFADKYKFTNEQMSTIKEALKSVKNDDE